MEHEKEETLATNIDESCEKRKNLLRAGMREKCKKTAEELRAMADVLEKNIRG